jgi:hypothetical protein
VAAGGSLRCPSPDGAPRCSSRPASGPWRRWPNRSRAWGLKSIPPICWPLAGRGEPRLPTGHAPIRPLGGEVRKDFENPSMQAGSRLIPWRSLSAAVGVAVLCWQAALGGSPPPPAAGEALQPGPLPEPVHQGCGPSAPDQMATLGGTAPSEASWRPRTDKPFLPAWPADFSRPTPPRNPERLGRPGTPRAAAGGFPRKRLAAALRARHPFSSFPPLLDRRGGGRRACPAAVVGRDRGESARTPGPPGTPDLLDSPPEPWSSAGKRPGSP